MFISEEGVFEEGVRSKEEGEMNKREEGFSWNVEGGMWNEKCLFPRKE